MQKVKCAIYVRKSSEKGLDLQFNSLQNQEEACKNYILSQSFNGWEYYKTYVDGGISGGTMKRPALIEMLADMKKGLFQTCLTYKVDRLSRSIIDFYNIMKEFEKYNCNFVSITQAFDTSTSMGKLTLNMLLSFAQFEREVSSERIRDKLAASKAKGYWTGGPPPLGYDVIDKKLLPNEKEIEDVKFIFETYLKTKSISRSREVVIDVDIRSKKWKSQNGKTKGGQRFSKSMLARLLRSKVYVGKIESKKDEVSYEGNHEAIIEKELFDQVQTLMDGNMNKHNESYDMNGYLLSGKIIDKNGNIFKNQKSSKNSARKYRYYALKGEYLPAGDFEEITFDLIKDLLDYSLNSIIDRSKAFEFKLIDFNDLAPLKQVKLIQSIIDKIIYHDNNLLYFIKIDDLSYLNPFKKENYLNTNNTGEFEFNGKIYISDDGLNLIVEKEVRINNNHLANKYIGSGKKIISITENHGNLIRALSLGWRYGKLSAKGISINQMKVSEQKGERTIYKYLSLNYLSPNIVNDIMDSRVPSHINLQTLFEIASKYIDFKDQEKAFYNE